MSSSGVFPGLVESQAQKLLQTLCNFILPLVQKAEGQTTNANPISFGIEADEFVRALEKFISRMILRSQPSGEDLGIKTTSNTFDYSEGADLLSETLGPMGVANIDARSNDDLEDVPEQLYQPSLCLAKSSEQHTNEHISELFGPCLEIPWSISESSTWRSAHEGSTNDADHPILQGQLELLRQHITQNMPIRLLCFERHNSKFSISLLERADIYNYIAPKFREEFHKEMYSWPTKYPVRRSYTAFSQTHPVVSKYTKYAILSHTWTRTPGELTYDHWKDCSIDAAQPKCQKLINFCKTAWEDHGLTLGWIDTVCINKESSAELDESIRSMYAWYSKADVCITYLGGTNSLPDMYRDPWFSRGWTFQELVAPECIKFYNKHWKKLDKSSNNDKKHPSILESIERATTITPDEVQNIRDASISRRMQLAARRQVTRKEDVAYCLMGIFGVNISTAYGEGPGRAFFRLLKKIFKSTKDVSDIFNWGGCYPQDSWTPVTSMFPHNPASYIRRFTGEWLYSWRPMKPLALTHLGLRTVILLMPAIPLRGSGSNSQPIGDYYALAHINLAACQDAKGGFEVHQTLPYGLLDKRASEQKVLHSGFPEKVIFGTLNVEGDGTTIRIPKACLAVCLYSQGQAMRGLEMASVSYRKVYTDAPIVFKLENRLAGPGNDVDTYYYQIERSQLAAHGMELATVYL